METTSGAIAPLWPTATTNPVSPEQGSEARSNQDWPPDEQHLAASFLQRGRICLFVPSLKNFGLS